MTDICHGERGLLFPLSHLFYLFKTYTFYRTDGTDRKSLLAQICIICIYRLREWDTDREKENFWVFFIVHQAIQKKIQSIWCGGLSHWAVLLLHINHKRTSYRKRPQGLKNWVLIDQLTEWQRQSEENPMMYWPEMLFWLKPTLICVNINTNLT